MLSPVTCAHCRSCNCWITDWQKCCTIGPSGTFMLFCPKCGEKMRITADTLKVVNISAAEKAQGYFFEEKTAVSV